MQSGTGTISLEVEIDEDYSAVTLSTMIAPSPDWYVAVVGVDLFENGEFVNSKKVNGRMYDAGTDSGETFTSSNIATSPQDTISYITIPPLVLGIAPQPEISEVTFTKIEKE